MNTKKLGPKDLQDANHFVLVKSENNSYSKTKKSSIFQRGVN
jgi:hypothetical protein